MKFSSGKLIFMIAAVLACNSCKNTLPPNTEMAQILAGIFNKNEVNENPFSSGKRADFFSSLYNSAPQKVNPGVEYYLAQAYLELGKEEKSLEHLEGLLRNLPEKDIQNRRRTMKDMAISWMRLGERNNCISNHGAESCIFPVKGKGVHRDQTGSEHAIEIYQSLLEMDPNDLESRWLLNIAYMTIDGYPQKVPKKYLLEFSADTSTSVKPFVDAAIQTGLNTKNLAGGSIVEDFDNDGYLDIVTSSWSLKEGMHYCHNNGNGTFSDVSEKSGLHELTGGLNIMQTDYNNDGFKDIFVVRGGWKRDFGKEPNSLLKNNGDGTFTDVTIKSGLLSFCPTQTATWADFNNDGWLDVFIGNETTSQYEGFPCELYINNQDGTFREIAKKAGVDITAYVKGVTSGDYNNDGLVDIFVSTLSGHKFLLKNSGAPGGDPKFINVSEKAGLNVNRFGTFSTWFWDYDNDGWLDILVCGYRYNTSLGVFAASEALGKPVPGTGQPILFRNNGKGGFEDVSEKMGLNKVAFGMGSNFGDIDNDGYLDFYLGTGNPDYTSLVPNKLFRSIKGSGFEDVTSPARVGNLQKGHGVSFADLDNDGDQDIHIDLGGAYDGDGYQNSLYINPGQNDNNWINITLKGVKSNTAAIGAKIKVIFTENGVRRSVYREVNSGSSFGANPLMQHVGIGAASAIESIEIKWPGTNTHQTIGSVASGKTIIITEGQKDISEVNVRKLDFLDTHRISIGCAPLKL